MSAKAIDLFEAYSKNQLPKDGGYIVSSFFDEHSTYSKYEVVAYNGVKSIYLSEDGLTFQTDGNKLFVLVEPPTYPKKHIEPFRRDKSEQIPHRFTELNIYTSKNQTKVMVSKEPIMTYSAFTILRPTGINFSLLFFNREDVLETIEYFFTQTLNKEAGVPRTDSNDAAKLVIDGINNFSIW
ncbi:MAG: hypothetical protein ACLFR1_03250 [Spirochaetia bacterium]